MDFKAVGREGITSVNLAQGKNKWRALTNTKP
jgi:hypothetical protein